MAWWRIWDVTIEIFFGIGGICFRSGNDGQSRERRLSVGRSRGLGLGAVGVGKEVWSKGLRLKKDEKSKMMGFVLRVGPAVV